MNIIDPNHSTRRHAINAAKDRGLSERDITPAQNKSTKKWGWVLNAEHYGTDNSTDEAPPKVLDAEDDIVEGVASYIEVDGAGLLTAEGTAEPVVDVDAPEVPNVEDVAPEPAQRAVGPTMLMAQIGHSANPDVARRLAVGVLKQTEASEIVLLDAATLQPVATAAITITPLSDAA